MNFGEKVRLLRREAGLTQDQLAEKIGVSRRSLIYYEQGRSVPSRPDVMTALADVFGVTTDELYSADELSAGEAGQRPDREAQEVIDNMCALFAGGELSDDDKDEAMHIVMEAYMRAKEKNRRFTPKKYSSRR